MTARKDLDPGHAGQALGSKIRVGKSLKPGQIMTARKNLDPGPAGQTLWSKI